MTIAGKRVLVTGADGFIGSHLVERLVRDGADVTAFCCYNSNSSHGWLDETTPEVRDAARLVLGDIRDPRSTEEAVAGNDIVLHLAALIAIPYSYVAPQSYVDTNITGTLHVLEACRRLGIERLVHTSTSEVYGTPEHVPITEDHPLQGQSPYSATKIGADKLCEAWACSFDVPVTILRPFNTYGPRQSMRAVIPTVLNQLLAGTEQLRLGSLDPQRDFTFVGDTVDGFVRAAQAPLDPGSVVQLGTGRTVSVGDLVALAMQVVGQQAEIVTDDDRTRPPASEVMVLLSDPSRAAELLGWSPSVSLEDGLRATAEWLAPRADPATAARYHR